jgi:hypothetical protein
MLIGEAQALFSERIEKFQNRLAQKTYIFQIRNDDGRDHFRQLSKRQAKLHFILVFADPNVSDFGSYFIRRGRARKYSIPDSTYECIMAKHNVDYDSEDDSAYWEATWELMDRAQRYWKSHV